MATSKLKEIRERNQLSQPEMAERLHMSQSAYSQLEMGKTSLKKEVIVMLIQEFGEDAAEILDSNGITLNVNAENNTINGTGAKQFYNYPPDLLKNITATKDGEIAYLKSVIETLLGKEDKPHH